MNEQRCMCGECESERNGKGPEQEPEMKPVAWVKYSVGKLPHFVPVIGGSAMFECSAIEALEYEPLYTADQLRAAKVEVLRDAASHMSIASDYAILWRMADAIEKGEVT